MLMDSHDLRNKSISLTLHPVKISLYVKLLSLILQLVEIFKVFFGFKTLMN